MDQIKYKAKKKLKYKYIKLQQNRTATLTDEIIQNKKKSIQMNNQMKAKTSENFIIVMVEYFISKIESQFTSKLQI